MPEITCPECGTEQNLVAIRRGADEFCPHCDFPLFWAATAMHTMQRGGSNDETLRRLPGAGGRRRIGSKICPECGELNPVGNVNCLRCGEELDPRVPEVEAPVIIAPAAKPIPVFIETPTIMPWWVWLFWATVVTSVVVAFVVTR